MNQRDATLIDAYCQMLADAWKQAPALRLCQLVVNVAGTNDPFYVEDAEFGIGLAEFIQATEAKP